MALPMPGPLCLSRSSLPGAWACGCVPTQGEPLMAAPRDDQRQKADAAFQGHRQMHGGCHTRRAHGVGQEVGGGSEGLGDPDREDKG